jgi:hypothetical protein
MASGKGIEGIDNVSKQGRNILKQRECNGTTASIWVKLFMNNIAFGWQRTENPTIRLSEKVNE